MRALVARIAVRRFLVARNAARASAGLGCVSAPRGEVAIASSPSTASFRPLRPGAGRFRGLRASEGAVVAPRAKDGTRPDRRR